MKLRSVVHCLACASYAGYACGGAAPAVMPTATAIPRSPQSVAARTEPVIGTFAAQPNPIHPGQSAILTWSAANATGLSIDGGVGTVTGQTSKVVSPSRTTAYTLTAASPGGSASATVTVTVIADPVSVAPALVYLWPAASETFKAQAAGISDEAVNWTVQEGDAGGTVTAAGTYTAPSVPGTYHVVATSAADPARSASATVVVTARPAGCAAQRTLSAGSSTAAPQPGPVARSSSSTLQAPGTWMNVTPPQIDPGALFVGVESVLADPVRRGDIYANIERRGTWKSTDYGLTWTKVNTGRNAASLDTGAAWYAAIDLNPCRDPSTPPTLYVVQGYGAGGIWKSVDGGVDWINVWKDNVYAPDGVTNIFADVGSDIHSIQIVDPLDRDHLIASLHSYWGSGNNNGVFETTDGGGKWIVHKSRTFNFQPHNDVVFAVDAKTWIVTPGDITRNMQRTTDGGATWNPIGRPPERSIGRNAVIVGSTIYAGTDYAGSVYKSIDRGASWTSLRSGGKTSWVAATATTLYAGSGYGYAAAAAHVLHAPLSNDTAWVRETPGGLMQNGSYAVTTFDGSHYILIAAEQRSGIWRYVEP